MMSRAGLWFQKLIRDEAGQTAVEYMLGISVIAVGMTVAFIYMADSTRGIFNHARQMVELPYP